MSDDFLFQLPSITVVDLVGGDSGAILNNLTTNDVLSLESGCGCETFITDVRGKTLAHVYVYRRADGFRLIGAAGQADAIISHADRYTIREDAVPTDRSAEFDAFVVSPEAPAEIRDEVDWAALDVAVYDVDWLGPGTLLLLAGEGSRPQEAFARGGIAPADVAAFHDARTRSGYPWYGVDLSEKNLPQEASRIADSICFTKGCYLGQETVARLDALGQVQKQLVLWKTKGQLPEAPAEVKANGKVVGKLTSICRVADDQTVAIGIARRSHFDSGATAEGEGFTATVI
jgi:folate-binding protein YgfZ